MSSLLEQSGIGAATARRFLEESADVVLNGRRKSKLEETANCFPGDRILIDSGDVSDKKYILGLVERTIDKFHHIDVLVNNAAISVLGLFGGTSGEDLHRVMKTNVDGVFYAIRGALPHLLQSKGSIVNVSFVTAILGRMTPRLACFPAIIPACSLETHAPCDCHLVANHSIRINSYSN